MSKNNLLPVSVLILISGAMFSSHFGVGDLIFPPILGRGAGTSWFVAALGYMIVNSVGVWLAYLACAHQNKSLTGIASTVLGDFLEKYILLFQFLLLYFLFYLAFLLQLMRWQFCHYYPVYHCGLHWQYSF